MAEKRASERIEVEETVDFQELTFPPGRGQSETSPVLDISEGGVLFPSKRELGAGTQLQLDLKLRSWSSWLASTAQFAELRDKPLTAIGEVVRCERTEDGQHRIGVRFTNIYPQHREALTKYLSAYRPLQEKMAQVWTKNRA